ncbi:hypothetical protein D9M71_216020 [compost metagenome]
MGFLKGEASRIELGEANVLLGVLGHEIGSTAATAGRIDIHAIAWNLLEQLKLAGRELARVLRDVVGVDAEQRLVVLELPMLAAHLAVAPTHILLAGWRPGRDHPIGTCRNLPAQRGQLRTQQCRILLRGLNRTNRSRCRNGHEQMPDATAGGNAEFWAFNYFIHWKVLTGR